MDKKAIREFLGEAWKLFTVVGFLSFAYVFIFISIPDLFVTWVLNQIDKDTIIIFSPEQVIVLVSFVFTGTLTYFFGKWAHDSWKDLFRKTEVVNRLTD